METNNIVKMYNEEGLGLKEIAEKLGSSKSTIQRKLVKDGWKFNRKANKYEINVSDETTNNETNVSRETINNGVSAVDETINNETNVSRETINNETNVSDETINIVNRTYGIPQEMDRALKIKCAIEGKKAVDIVREALKNAIEPKYFDYK
jgi:uncharacterized protein YjcR